MDRLSITQLKLQDLRVLLRADFNVPINEQGEITDDYRLVATLPTIQHILTEGGRLILISHLGRPEGKTVKRYSLLPVAEALQNLLKIKVSFCTQTVGDAAEAAVSALKAGQVLLLENLRFNGAETKNDPHFAQQIAKLADVFISDAFGVLHRTHSSTDALPRCFKQAASGLLVEKEIKFLNKVFKDVRLKKSAIAVLGGAKVSDKISLIQALLNKVNSVLIGGAMAYTFLKSQGLAVGNSPVESEQLKLATDLLKNCGVTGKSLVLPIDHVIAPSLSNPEQAGVCGVNIPAGMAGFDIGPMTSQAYTNSILRAKLVFWNGPMGVFEKSIFAKGTLATAQAMADSQAVTVAGGGDSIAAIRQANLAQNISHISTGGGASMAYLEKETLPGLLALSSA